MGFWVQFGRGGGLGCSLAEEGLDVEEVDAGIWVFGGDWAGEGRRKKNEKGRDFGGLGPAEEEELKREKKKVKKKKKKKKKQKIMKKGLSGP